MPLRSPARRASSRNRHDEGFTLVELLVTVTIMALTFMVLFGAISVFVKSTTVHRTTADLDRATRSYVEQLDGVAYANCATSYSVAPSDLPADFSTKFQPAITVKYWDGTPAPAGFTTSCPATDLGVQQLTLTMTRVGDGQQDQLTIVKTRS
jgi:prepilin-type N-terminal cleavage/methylation domain-containing protein